MAKNSCVLVPLVNGKPSKLYTELLKMTLDRSLTNYIYATYLTNSEVGDLMDNDGYSRDSNGEHRAKDIHKILNIAQYENIKGDLGKISVKEGIKTTQGNTVDFTNGEEAIQKAEQINNTYDKVVASVIQIGDVFNIILEPVNSQTQIKALRTRRQYNLWNIAKETFGRYSINIRDLDFARDILNPLRIKLFIEWIGNVQRTDNRLLSVKDIKILLAMNENNPTAKSLIDRLKSIFGDLDAIALKIYDAYRAKHIGQVVTLDQWIRIDATMSNCKKMNGLEPSKILEEFNDWNTTIAEQSKIQLVENTLEKLRKKYKIDNKVIHRKSEEIKSLQEAAVDAAYTLQRQLKKLTDVAGITPEALLLDKTLKKILREIENNRYHTGLLEFLSEATAYVLTIQASLDNIPQGGNNLETARNMALTVQEAKSTMSGYYSIVKALSKMDTLIIDLDMTLEEKQKIQLLAQEIKKMLDTIENRIEDTAKATMRLVLQEYLGESLANGASIDRLVELAAWDSSLWDGLYGVGKVSNPLIAVMGNVIRDALDARNAKMVAISKKIRNATRKLYKAGHDSEFMYKGGGYIISDIDWELFNSARKEAIKLFIKEGCKGLALKERIDAWEEAHMEDRIVDPSNGRTEKVPNENYRQEMPLLTPAQEEYYKTMMDIRGEIGSMLPIYAQRHHYIAPQLRRSFVDAMRQARKNRSLKQAKKAISTKVKDWFVIREDDTMFASNGIIEGEDYHMDEGALDNTPYRQIPIFYLKKIKDLSELLKDFSGGMLALANTAINFECMNEILNLVEVMGDFIKQKKALPSNGDDLRTAEGITGLGITLFKDLVSRAQSSLSIGIIDGFIDKHIYGILLKKVGKMTKFWQSLLKYTSLRALAVNVKGAIANVVNAEILMLIEAGAGEFYNVQDYLYAHTKVFGDNTINAPGRIMDYMTNNRNSRAVLLAELFDPLNEEFESLGNERYYKGPIRHLLGKDFSFVQYGTGEHMVHYVTMYAVLHNIKVKIDGKESSLIDAFYIRKEPGEENSTLKLKDNVTYKDSNGNDVLVDDEFLMEVKKKIRYCNLSTHGAMNEEDKGLIHLYMLGRFAMNLRLWMVEHYSRRYRKSHWDANLGEEREGYYTTVWNFLKDLRKDEERFNIKIAQHWKLLTPHQKANFKRFRAEMLILFSLVGLSFALGSPDDHKGELWMRMWIYLTQRALTSTHGSIPTGIPIEAKTMMNSPIAATSTISAMLYPFYGISDIDDTIQNGPYKDWNKYGRNMAKYWLPFWGQIDLLYRMDEDDSIFTVFDYKM